MGWNGLANILNLLDIDKKSCGENYLSRSLKMQNL